MAGIENNIIYGGGFKLQTSSSRDISDMQRTSLDVSSINHVGTPQGSISANPSSLSHDPVSGIVYIKQSGTGNTGWAALSTTLGTVTSVSGTTNRITSTGGATPVIDISASYVGQSSITTLGTITTGVWNGSVVGLVYGGTNANLTASNGGILYSTASAVAILAGTATAGQMLRSGATGAPSWSTATYPATAGTSGNVLTSDGTNWSSSAPLPDYHAARYIVSAGGASDGANYTTIATAYAAAVATGVRQTVFIQPGTYTENLTLTGLVNLCAFQSDASFNQTGNVIISGTLSMATAGTVTVSGIQLQTNSANLLSITGSSATIVNLFNCNLNCTNTTGISFTTSNTAALINVFNCSGNIGTTGISLYSMSSTGNLRFKSCNFTNSGASTTASSNSSGSVTLFSSFFASPLSTSSSGTITLNYSQVDSSAQNATAITTAGTGVSGSNYSRLLSGSASAVSIGSGTIFNLQTPTIDSTNTNAITGAGTYTILNPNFVNTSHNVNTTTQGSSGAVYGLTQGTAPAAGLLGEQRSSAVTTVALANNTPKTITSINLTAGIWDVTGLICLNASGAVLTDVTASISTTNNTVAGNLGDLNARQIVGISTVTSLVVPVVRATLSATTTYYLVSNQVFASGTCNGQGRITATRVG